MRQPRKRGEAVRRPAGIAARQRMLDGIPVRARRLDVDGVSTSVLDAGSGSPLVLLHGGIETGGAYWTPVISRLAESHRLVVPDVPGLGESEPVARLDLPTFEAWFTTLLAQTCEEKPVVVAHSLLGTMAARFAAVRGDVLEHLVIYGAPGVGPYRLPAGLALAAILFDLRPSPRNSERFERWAFLDRDRTSRMDPEWFEAFGAYAMSRAAVPHVKRTMRYLIKTCTKQVPDDDLAAIRVPTTLLWGRHDRMVPLGLADGASLRHGWPLRVIDDTGHVPHIERPDAFAGAVADLIGTERRSP